MIDTFINNDTNLHLVHPTVTLLRQIFHLQTPKHEKMPSAKVNTFDIFEDKSPPHDIKDLVIAAHDRANARGKEAIALAWWNCYERARVDPAVANLLWAILQQRTTQQDQNTFRNSFLTPAEAVVARRKTTILVERHLNVANGQCSICKSIFYVYLTVLWCTGSS